ncbi:MAG: lactonase family protein [Lentisphaerae bacterium]|nr:lactonase family protein [Lentisphaerota bacterium]
MAAAQAKRTIFIGTLTAGGSEGIYRCTADAESGTLSPPVLCAALENPAFLALDSRRRYLFSVREIRKPDGGREGGAIAAFRVRLPEGALETLNRCTTGGPGPCHAAVDPSGRCVAAANYLDGSVAAYTVGADGFLSGPTAFVRHAGSSVNPERQEAPHAHSANIDPAGRFVLVCDLGTDDIVIYGLDARRGTLARRGAVRMAAGSGPRHLAFHPNGRWLYVSNELANTVSVLDYDAGAGAAAVRQTLSTLPRGAAGPSTCSEVALSADGRFVYCANRGDDSMAVFRADPASGRLEAAGHFGVEGRTPRHFALLPGISMLIVANQDSDALTVFRLDAASGLARGCTQTVPLSKPMCIRPV